MNPARIAKHHLIHGLADPRANAHACAVQNVPIQSEFANILAAQRFNSAPYPAKPATVRVT